MRTPKNSRGEPDCEEICKVFGKNPHVRVLSTNADVLLIVLIGSSSKPSPDGWGQAFTNWAPTGPQKSVWNCWEDITHSELCPAAPALGSGKGAEVRALDLVVTALVCSGLKLLDPLGCLRGRCFWQCQGYLAEELPFLGYFWRQSSHWSAKP